MHSSTLSTHKLLAVLEQKVEGTKGTANRAIRAHICRVHLVEVISTFSGESKLPSLEQISETLQSLVNEDESQSQAPKSSALRLLLAVACKEAMKEGNASKHRKFMQMVRLTKMVRLLKVQLGKPCQYRWINPQDEWVAEPGSKHAIKAESVEGVCEQERLHQRWDAVTAIHNFAKRLAEGGSIGWGTMGFSVEVGHGGISSWLQALNHKISTVVQLKLLGSIETDTCKRFTMQAFPQIMQAWDLLREFLKKNNCLLSSCPGPSGSINSISNQRCTSHTSCCCPVFPKHSAKASYGQYGWSAIIP